MNNEDFVIVKIDCLPIIFKKVIQVKKMLETGKEKNIQDAVNALEISRSAYYKYKDKIFPLENTKGKIVTISINVDDIPGTLANILKYIAEQEYNILTINQTIPINGIANLTVTINTGSNDISFLQKELLKLDGIKSFKILAME